MVRFNFSSSVGFQCKSEYYFILVLMSLTICDLINQYQKLSACYTMSKYCIHIRKVVVFHIDPLIFSDTLKIAESRRVNRY